MYRKIGIYICRKTDIYTYIQIDKQTDRYVDYKEKCVILKLETNLHKSVSVFKQFYCALGIVPTPN